MADVAQAWQQALPTIRNGVTGIGVWTALNSCTPIAIEDGVLVLGLPGNEAELIGHLRIPNTRKLIEAEVSRAVGSPLNLRVIEGTTDSDWERAKRRDAEARRLQEAALERSRAELSARTNWESVYEQLSRRYAAVSNKSVPMNRARFYEEAVAFLGECRRNQTSHDDLNERNFARCIERLAQYAEVPSTLVAVAVLRAAGEMA